MDEEELSALEQAARDKIKQTKDTQQRQELVGAIESLKSGLSSSSLIRMDHPGGSKQFSAVISGDIKIPDVFMPPIDTKPIEDAIIKGLHGIKIDFKPSIASPEVNIPSVDLSALRSLLDAKLGQMVNEIAKISAEKATPPKIVEERYIYNKDGELDGTEEKYSDGSKKISSGLASNSVIKYKYE